MTDPGPETIEVFADVMCPFAHVGLRRLVDRRAALGRGDVMLVVRGWPLEVINGRVLDPEVVAEEIDQLRATVAPDLFLGFRASAMPSTTLLAMDLTAAGYAQGRDAGEALALGLRVALFERGQDVSDPGVLQALADEAGVQGWEPPAPGVESESVAADHADGTERGVIGSPHFFTSAGSHFCPSLDVSRDESGALVVRTDPEGFEQLLAGVFGD